MSNNLIINPAGWPSHLVAYNPGRHRPRTAADVTFYPYNHTAARVKSFLAMRDGTYLGLVTADRDRPLQVIRHADGASNFPRTFNDAASFLLANASGVTQSTIGSARKRRGGRSAPALKVTRFRNIYRVETCDGEYVGFLDRRVSSDNGRTEYRAAGSANSWRSKLRHAVTDLVNGRAE